MNLTAVNNKNGVWFATLSLLINHIWMFYGSALLDFFFLGILTNY
jgi:hypothetical protein